MLKSILPTCQHVLLARDPVKQDTEVQTNLIGQAKALPGSLYHCNECVCEEMNMRHDTIKCLGGLQKSVHK